MVPPTNPFPSFCNFSFCFLNANHSKTANILLNRDLNEKNFDIAFVNEPYFYNNEVVYFNKHYKVFTHCDIPRAATVVINKNCHSSTILIECDIIIINIDYNGDKYTLINIYIPPSVSIDDYLNYIELYLVKYVNNKIF